jgi:YggT family protein
MPNIVKSILIWALNIFLLLMIVRFIVDLVMSLSRNWRPSGFMTVILEITYTATDPPLRLLRRFIPPLRMGRVALDLSFLLLFIIVQVLIRVVAQS